MDWLKNFDLRPLLASLQDVQPALDLLLPLLGAGIIGALIATWGQARRDAADKLQTWFEQNYIIDGLDKCSALLLELRFHFHCVASATPPPDTVYGMPMEALVRVNDLLPAGGFYNVLSHAVREANRLSTAASPLVFLAESEQREADELLTTVNDLLLVIGALKQDVLDHGLKRRRDVFGVRQRLKWDQHVRKIEQLETRLKEALKDGPDEPRSRAREATTPATSDARVGAQ